MTATDRARTAMELSEAAHPQAAFAGMLVGGLLAIYLLSKLIEWAIIKRLFNDPLAGCVLSVVAAYILAVIIYGFGSANGGPWQAGGVVGYLPGAIIVAVVRTWLRKRRIDRLADEAE